ncbi:MAG: hypothetical protein SFV17_12775 [Candidatus Obscuribacter sp.]|nr:hypothetical protein [Candidatus Obscuribacter sp.]
MDSDILSYDEARLVWKLLMSACDAFPCFSEALIKMVEALPLSKKKEVLIQYREESECTHYGLYVGAE